MQWLEWISPLVTGCGVLALIGLALRAWFRGRVSPVLWLLPAVVAALTGEVSAAVIADGAGPDGLLPALDVARHAWEPSISGRTSAAWLGALAGLGAAATIGRVPARDPRTSPVGLWLVVLVLVVSLGLGVWGALWLGLPGVSAAMALLVAGVSAGRTAAIQDAHDEISDGIGPRTRLRVVAALGLGVAAVSESIALSRAARVWALEQAMSMDMSLGWWVADETFQAQVFSWSLALVGLALAGMVLLPALGSLASPRAPAAVGFPLLLLVALGGARWAAEARVEAVEDLGSNAPVLDLISHEVRTVSVRQLAGSHGQELVHLDLVPIGDVIAWDGSVWRWRLRRTSDGWVPTEGVVDPLEVGSLGHPMLLIGGRAPGSSLLALAGRLPPGTPVPAVPFRQPRTEFLLHPLFAHLQVTWLLVRSPDRPTPPSVDALSGHRLTATGRREVPGHDRAQRVRNAAAANPDGPVVVRVGRATVRNIWQACAALAVAPGQSRPAADERRCLLVP